ncbi:MAG: glycosyltransferase [Cyclobacteriaceae bacterium]
MVAYSIIIPVYNRPEEIQELLEGLSLQTFHDFEVIVVEDGSVDRCESVAELYEQKLTIKYFFKENSGPGASRNFGMERANGNFFIFLDSDCLVPTDYLQQVDQHLRDYPLDAFGGPDSAHQTFTKIQKAINYAMTSFLTTGGIRGGKKKLDRFQPRSFNMGISREVFQNVGGFRSFHPGEDPDLSYRIIKSGFKTGLIQEAFVYHKRRIDFSKFIRQVYKFGLARTILMKWHPGSFKLVYALPSFFLIGLICLLGFSIAWPWLLLPILVGGLLLFADAILRTKSLQIAFMGVFASVIQIAGYGYGFLTGLWHLWILRKDEKVTFPGLFFPEE